MNDFYKYTNNSNTEREDHFYNEGLECYEMHFPLRRGDIYIQLDWRVIKFRTEGGKYFEVPLSEMNFARTLHMYNKLKHRERKPFFEMCYFDDRKYEQ